MTDSAETRPTVLPVLGGVGLVVAIGCLIGLYQVGPESSLSFGLFLGLCVSTLIVLGILAGLALRSLSTNLPPLFLNVVASLIAAVLTPAIVGRVTPDETGLKQLIAGQPRVVDELRKIGERIDGLVKGAPSTDATTLREIATQLESVQENVQQLLGDRPGHGRRGQVLYVPSTETYRVLRAKPILFDVRSPLLLKHKNQAALEGLDALSRDSEQFLIEVHGHTDRHGDDASNFKLGYDRALAVKNHLVDKRGIDEASVAVFTHGEQLLLCTTETSACDESNRRVEVKVFKRARDSSSADSEERRAPEHMARAFEHL